jgi:hypothetical protein
MGETTSYTHTECRGRQVVVIRMSLADARDLYRRQYAAAEREKNIMRDVPAWKPRPNEYWGHR